MPAGPMSQVMGIHSFHVATHTAHDDNTPMDQLAAATPESTPVATQNAAAASARHGSSRMGQFTTRTSRDGGDVRTLVFSAGPSPMANHLSFRTRGGDASTN